MANRLTQVSREVLEQGAGGDARLTQVSREVLDQGAGGSARLTQVAREVLVRVDFWNPADRVAPATSESAEVVKVINSVADTSAPATSETATVEIQGGEATHVSAEDAVAPASAEVAGYIQTNSATHTVAPATGEAAVLHLGNRLTSVAREVLTGPGSPAARITQVAREVLERPGSPAGRLTQVAREVLIRERWWNPAGRAAPATSETAVLVRLSFPLAEAVVPATGEAVTPGTQVHMDPLDGVNLHCYTGDGEPVASPVRANYVF